MKFYLTIINPIIAVIVLAFCLWAGISGDSGINIANLFKGSLSSYFFAKGLFCSSSLFILGKILEILLNKGFNCGRA